jgi:hypothetical protein
MMSPEDNLHPPAPKLDAVAAGDPPGSIAAHLEACEACAAYVARMTAEASAFRMHADPVAFAEAVRRRATARRRAARIWVAAPLVAAAAAVLLWLHATPDVSRGSTVPGSATVTSSAPANDVARFKGGLSVAAVRERAGRQERLTGPFEVQPSDRIRIEIALDHEEPVTAGLLSSDGTWTVLEAPVTLGAGTHYSDLAARFDETPGDATLLVGSPADVDRARASRNFEGVVAWRVTSAPSEEHR